VPVPKCGKLSFVFAMILIDQFLARYRKEFDFYSQVSRLGAQLIEQQLQSAGIRAIVTWRAKSLSRLAEKIRQRSEAKNYQSVDDIFKDVVDLAGSVDDVARKCAELGLRPKVRPR